MRTTTVPIRLNIMCIQATRFAFLLTPILEIREVIHVPMFWPMIIGIAIPYVIIPVLFVIVWSIATDAAELWIIAVNTAPTTTPTIGLVKILRIGSKAVGLAFAISDMGSIASPISCMPNIKTPKPTRI